MIRLTLVALFFALGCTPFSPRASAAETTTTTAGYEFYVALPPGYGSEEWTFYFASAETGTVSVDYPTGLDTTTAVRPGATSSTVVPDTHEIRGSEKGILNNKRIRISSTVPTTVYGCSRETSTSDCTSFVPYTSWGTRYRPLSWPTDYASSSLGDRLTIVSGQETSTVRIAFRTAINTTSGNFSAGQETSIVLTSSQVLSFEGATNGQTFSGALITASSPVGVFAGNECTSGFGGACDTNVEMVPPVSSWGTNFYLNNYKNSNGGGSGVRIIADQDSTTVLITGDHTISTTLSAGQVYSSLLFNSPRVTNSSIIISSSKPILLGHFMTSGTYNSGASNQSGDPSLSYMPPYQQFLDSYTFANVAGFNAQFVNVLIPDTAISSLRFDGTAVASANFRSIGTTGWSSAQLNSSTGSHTLTASMPFGIEVYGANPADSYAYVGGANYSALSTVAALQVTSASQSGTVGQQVCVPVNVKDASDAPVPGVRVDGTTTGANGTNYLNAQTNSGGLARLCYTGTSSGTDTVTASANGFTTSANVTWTLTAPDISYTPSSVQLATNVAMPSLTPSNSGGTVASWSVSPSLPSGLSINSTTGVISGTPLSNQSSTGYTVTATNAAGSDTASVSISIAAAQQPTISYSPSTYIFTLDSPITTINPSTSGTFPTWSVSPTLPAGLSINTQNGQISGTPTRRTSIDTYTVTATNTAGSSTTTLILTVNETVPDISFSLSSYSFATNQAISTITPLNSGSPATSWSISPSLPSGLSFNSTTGQITGTPTGTSAATSYSVTGSNSAGSDSATISITITSSLQVPSITYSPSSYSGQINVTMTTLTPSNSGGSAASWSISPTLPTGISFSTLTGIISGTPTSTLSQTYFTVTATNSSGSDTETVSITVTGIGGATVLTLAFDAAILTKGASVTISATASQAGNVAFYERGKILVGCKSRPTVALVATCAWKPKYHGSSSVSATLTPTDNIWTASSARVITNVLKRTSRS